MLHAQDANRPLPPHDRHARKAVEQLFARLGPIAIVRMRRRLVQVQRFHIGGDQADKPLPHRHAGDVDGLLLQTARREQFQQALAHQIDGANLARQRLADNVHDLVQLRLRARSRSHHLL